MIKTKRNKAETIRFCYLERGVSLRPQVSKNLLMVIIFLLSIFTSGFVLAEKQTNQVLIIDMPRLTFTDFRAEFPNLLKLAKTGAVGIMTMPTPEPIRPEKIYYELNSCSTVKTVEEGMFVLNVNEEYQGIKAGELYRSLTGYRYPSSGAVNVGFPKVLFVNSNTGPVVPSLGLAGQALHQSGMKTAAIGNADSDPEKPNRLGAVLFMDEKGQVDLASVGNETLKVDPKFPFGKRTDSQQILSLWNQYKEKAQVVVITLGDLERINGFHRYLSESRLEYHRNKALLEYDQLIGQLLSQVDFQKTMVLLFSVAGPDSDSSLQRLNPVIIHSSTINRGLLVSNSTRRPAIVTGFDLMATVFHHLGVNRSVYSKGRNLSAKSGDWKTILTLQHDLAINYDLRWPLLTVYGYLFIGLVVVFILGMSFIRFINRKYYHLFIWAEKVYLVLLIIPLTFLILALFNPINWLAILFWTVVIAGGLFGLFLGISRGKNKRIFYWVSLTTVAGCMVDGLSNGFTELRSFLGYSAIAGVRFYGMGNEYMGFLLGAYICFLAIALSQAKRIREWPLWIGMIVLALVIAYPTFGSNIGGGISTLIGLGVTNYLLLQKKIGVKQLLFLGSLVFLLLGFIGFCDVSLNSKVSHFGQFIHVVKNDGLKAVLDVFYRKWQMNLSIIAYTPLSKILIFLLLMIPFLYNKPPRFLAKQVERARANYPFLIRGFMGLVFTALIALVVNDSGIVSVATMFMFGLNLIFTIFVESKMTDLPGVGENE